MQTKKAPSLITTVRRQQIVDAAIVVLARDGLSQTSLVRVAQEAGLSSAGLVSYHFAGKDELFGTVVDHLTAHCVRMLEAALAGVSGASASLGAYVAAFMAFQDQNRAGVAALWRLSGGWKAPGRTQAVDVGPLLAPLREILRAGQRSGEFRRHRGDWVARSLFAALESYHRLLADDPELDAAAYGRELTAVYRRGLRARR